MPAKNGFELQDRDIELLHHVFVLRLATVDHLAALSGRSVRALWGRLHKLGQRRYLRTVARHMQKHVYASGSQGIAALVEQGHAPQEIADKRLTHRELSEIGIRHSLFIADIHTRLLLQTKSGPITLPHWEEGPSLWDNVPSRDGEAAIPVRPDAYFVLRRVGQKAKNKFHFFLEADRSTMSHERMAAKIEGYVRYYERRLHTKKYAGMHSFLVATVTETRRRAEELRQDLHTLIPHAARQAYLFIPVEDLALAALLPNAAAATSVV